MILTNFDYYKTLEEDKFEAQIDNIIKFLIKIL